MRVSPRLLQILCLSAGLAACSSDPGSGEGIDLISCDTGEPSGGDDGVCPDGTVAENGACVPSDGDCPDGTAIAADGSCVPSDCDPAAGQPCDDENPGDPCPDSSDPTD